jgi:Mn2+/Fe2+ NRAMP family transporter
VTTGAADDDPSGIATYSQLGAQFGYGLAWTMLFSFPLMAVIQAVSARIGVVTGCGIAQNLRRHYSPWLLRAIVLLLLTANVINLGADLGAMGAALGLMIGGPVHLYTVLFGIVCILLETFISYARYAAVLKWATLSLFTYVAVVFAAHVPWGLAEKVIVGGEAAAAQFAKAGDIANVAMAVAAYAALAWTIWHDTHAGGKKPEPEAIHRELRLKLPAPKGLNAAGRDEIIIIIVEEVVKK